MGLLINSIVLVMLACLLFSNYNEVEGGRKLSKDEDIELEKQLKLLKKPAVKTIQTEYGDIYDCIDFYKQPAFDHPLLKNHSFDFQTKPSSVPKELRENKVSTTNTKPMNIGLKGGGCPSGTVPIRRVTKDDLIRLKLHSEKIGSKYGVLNHDYPGTHFAVVRTQFDPRSMYNGGGGSFSIYNPNVSGFQYSSARIKIQNGLDYILFGWTVFPTLYHDNKPRVYTYLKAGQTRCFNTYCNGFVLVDPSVPIDSDFDNISKRGEDSYATSFFIYRDHPTGNWWLVISDSGKNVHIGYFPQRIFSGLADLATSVDWGGEVFSPTNVPSPAMGSSYYPIKSTNYDGYCGNMTTINRAHQLINAVATEEYHDVDSYKVIDVGNVKGEYNHLMLYGGPGGYTGE